MKINWRVLVALALIVGVGFWAVDTVRSRSYTGSDLPVEIGSGPVTVTNSANEPVPVQLVGTGTRPFSVSSTIEGLSGSSSRQGSGRNTSQLFEFELPTGVTEFTVSRGSHVDFRANADTNLEMTLQPQNAADARSAIIVAVLVVLGALFYISRTTGHRWIGALRRQETADETAKRVAERLSFKRMFGGVSSDKS